MRIYTASQEKTKNLFRMQNVGGNNKIFDKDLKSISQMPFSLCPGLQQLHCEDFVPKRRPKIIVPDPAVPEPAGILLPRNVLVNRASH